MYYVYILKSKKNFSKLYVGYTKNVERRLSEHNSTDNKDSYTAMYRPWVLESYIGVRTKQVAQSLERYLKQGSGFAFMKKRFLAPKNAPKS